MTPRMVASVTFFGVLLLAPAWTLLLMVAGNGLGERQGSWLFGINGLCLLALAVAGPRLAARLTCRWQRRYPPALAMLAALAATVLAILLALSAASLLTFALLTT